MFGQFLELALATADIAASVRFYERLGYQQLPCTDSWPHAYCALGDGQFVIGLHRRDAPAAAPCFVHAGLVRHGAALAAAGFTLLHAQLGEEQFHRLLLQAPDHGEVQLLEARTYSPAAIRADASVCGTLLAFSLPAADADAAAAFWERGGLVAFAEQELPWPHRPLTADGVNLALHRPALLPQPALVYTATDLTARIEALRGRDLTVAAWSAPGLPSVRGALLRAPEGNAILLLPEPGT